MVTFSKVISEYAEHYGVGWLHGLIRNGFPNGHWAAMRSWQVIDAGYLWSTIKLSKTGLIAKDCCESLMS